MENNTEFDLSKKIIISNKYIDNFFYEEDVKEFIRLVKKEIENNISSTTIYGREIKKQTCRR
jgi:hypothetical protein